MVDRRAKNTGRRTGYPFLSMKKQMINHSNFARLSPRAVKLLVDVASQYRGYNNGDLTATWSVMKCKGWTSKDQLEKALKELLESGWLVVTRQGRVPRVPTLYALTWESIDYCGGKLERASSTTALNYWKQGFNPEYTAKCKEGKKLDSVSRHTGHTAPPHGSMN